MRTVSLLPQNSIGKYGRPQDSEKATVDTPLHIVDFDDVITTCRNPKTKSDKKHQCGAIYAYKQNKLGVTENSVSGGIIFCDIDNITKEVAKDIYEHFQSYNFFTLVAIQVLTQSAMTMLVCTFSATVMS